MSVRAKFTVTSITRTQTTVWDGSKSVPCEVQTIKLWPVIDGSAENKSFFASTPSGSIELGTINVEAAKQFELNKNYYVDFTAAE
jgi:hypothetical protein